MDKSRPFEKVHEYLLNINILYKINTSTTLNFYIDATHINNVAGIDEIGFYGNKKKNDKSYSHT
jgi:hypothetical protein